MYRVPEKQKYLKNYEKELYMIFLRLSYLIILIFVLSGPQVYATDDCEGAVSSNGDLVGLSTWVRNVLAKGGIKTLKALMEKTEAELLMLLDGKYKDLFEIETYLSERGFTLKNSRVEGSPNRMRDKLINRGVYTLEGLTKGTRFILARAGIYTIEDLAEKTEAELLMLPNMKQRNLFEIEAYLSERGLRLKDSGLQGLSNRMKDRLANRGIYTLEALTERTREELDIAKGDLLIIESYLSERGFMLRDSGVEGLSNQMRYDLENRGIYTLEALTEKTREELGIDGRALLTNELSMERDLKFRDSSRLVERGLKLKDSDRVELSLWIREALRIKGVYTPEALLEKTREELLAVPNVDQVTLSEIEIYLAERGLRLKDSGLEELPNRTENRLKNKGIYTIEALTERTREELGMGVQALSTIETHLAERGLKLRDSDLDLEELKLRDSEFVGLSLRTRVILAKEGVYTPEALTEKTGIELLAVPNVDQGTLGGIKSFLEERGLKLKDSGLEELSDRMRDRLANKGIYTLEALTERTREELGMGMQALSTIETYLAERGLKLRDSDLDLEELKLRDSEFVGLSLRTRVILAKEGVYTPEALTEKTGIELLAVPNVDQGTLGGIKSFLEERGLKLKDSGLEELSDRMRDRLANKGIYTLEALTERTREELGMGMQALSTIETYLAERGLKLRDSDLDLEELKLRDSEFVGLSLRTRVILAKEGVYTPEALTEKTGIELLAVPNVDQGTLGGIKSFLKERGLKLKDSEFEKLSVSMWAKMDLAKEGVDTPEALAGKTEEELLMLPNVGPGTLFVIRPFLKERGLKLKDSDSAPQLTRERSIWVAIKNWFLD